jgi:hypothetical protein
MNPAKARVAYFQKNDSRNIFVLRVSYAESIIAVNFLSGSRAVTASSSLKVSHLLSISTFGQEDCQRPSSETFV